MTIEKITELRKKYVATELAFNEITKEVERLNARRNALYAELQLTQKSLHEAIDLFAATRDGTVELS